MADQKPPYTRTQDENIISSIQKDTSKGRWDLNESERWWRDRYNFLLRRGYSLRPRFRPGWTPSWLGTNVLPFYCEDSLRNVVRLLESVPHHTYITLLF